MHQWEGYQSQDIISDKICNNNLVCKCYWIKMTTFCMTQKKHKWTSFCLKYIWQLFIKRHNFSVLHYNLYFLCKNLFLCARSTICLGQVARYGCSVWSVDLFIFCSFKFNTKYERLNLGTFHMFHNFHCSKSYENMKPNWGLNQWESFTVITHIK